MKMTDKRFWHGCGNAINELFLWLFIAFALLLTIDLWSLIVTAISYLIEDGPQTVILLKIFSALGIVLILFSHITLWQTMYSPRIYNRLISFVWNKRLRLLHFLSLGYVSVYLLNLYFIRFKYSLYELTQYRVNVGYSVLVMFPIINIPVYVNAIRHRKRTLALSESIKLYLQGRLATYLIQSDYATLIQEENLQ